MTALLALALAGQIVATLPQSARNTVPATAFACHFTTADGAAIDISGITPLFVPGRDPNARQAMVLAATGLPLLAGNGGVNVLDASDMFRDFQIFIARGEASFVANLKFRAGSGGIGWMTRYAPTTPPEPFRYFAAGHCRSDFEGKPVS